MSQHDPKDVRQGGSGTRVLVILIAALAVAALVAVFMGGFGSSQPGTSPELEAEGAAPAQSVSEQESEMVAPEADTGSGGG
ncbi:hypothetical protein FP2506_06556 [Fulvimarina pelagi HTCC2506]|uniref:Uncharacterized protein n=1 Tax=Fulvimarina pelagi HTCC2506 TaxID=314231 RepID=Q0G785_9HYPH|nr:hypothetical protein [Fulvimarina pelagi]EAU42479.1 hypothetical protein FP2506_06556 [Fulvimarina pelagi HTCC2506]